MTASHPTRALDGELAIRGGRPVRDTFLPYGRQTLDDDDRAAVAAVLSSDWLTTGPKVAQFEKEFAWSVGAREAVAVNSGTAALHAALAALQIGPGDEVILPSITFAATANAAVFLGATPVFADVDRETLLISPSSARGRLSDMTRAIMVVDYAGQPADYDELSSLSTESGVPLVADACHSLGGSFTRSPRTEGQIGTERQTDKVGTLARLNAFSFHPVKNITTGEGGMITTEEPELAGRMRVFRNHGITTDHHERRTQGEWAYEMQTLGYNYRLSDISCALGLSQLPKLAKWVARRNELAAYYREALRDVPQFKPLALLPHRQHAYHLFVVRCQTVELGWTRDQIFAAMRAENIGVNVHYLPVHLHPFYRDRFGTRPGLCPQAEAAFQEILTLPLFATMTERDIDDVCRALRKIVSAAPVLIAAGITNRGKSTLA